MLKPGTWRSAIGLQDVTYTVRSNVDKKVEISLLDNVSGYLKSGELVALMG
jgi:hypothetical protein